MITPTEIQRTLGKIGLRPQQAAGQNFLLDEGVVQGMVTAAAVTANDTVLEIGPGLGILTAELVATGAKVVAVELDQRLFAYLKKKFASQKNLRLIRGDIFRINLTELLTDNQYKLVANLPYSATSLVFRNFLTLNPRPSSLTVMVQRDVAKRICAPPGEMSLLALTVQYYCQPSILFDIPPKSFFPAPRVMSTVIYGDRLRPVQPEKDQALFRLMRAGFSSRRKQLHNTLSASLHIKQSQVTTELKKLGLPKEARAQELSVENWLKLAKNLG